MSDLPAESGPSKIDLLGEAYRRGILPPDKVRLFEEGQKRGLFKAPAQPAGGLQVGGAVASPGTTTGLGQAISGLTPDVSKIGQGVADKASRVRGDMRQLQGYEQQADYDTGTGWTDAVAMHRADNPAEKRAYLSKKYGPDNVFTDRGGRFLVRDQSGKVMSPEGTGFVNNFMSGVAGLYADAPIIAGATGGAMLGAPGGPAGAIAGAMLGGAAGKGAIELPKILTGDAQKTLGQSAEALGKAGLYSGVGEGAGRLVTGIPGAAGNLFRKYLTGTTPEARDLAASVERSGGVAPLRSVAPGLSSPIQKQDISSRLGADWLEDPNRAATHKRLSEIVESTGMGPAERDAAIKEILDPTARVSSRESGIPVMGDVRQHAAHLEADVENLSRDADRILTGQLGRLSAIPRRAPSGNLGEDIAAGIGEARRDFSRSMQNIYARVDQATGGAPIVPAGAVKREARRILQALPKDQAGEPIFGDPRVLKSIRQLRDMGPRMTLSDAQSIRSTLGEMGEFTDLTPGVEKRQFDDLRTSVNTAIKLAEADPAAAPAVRMLRRADDIYGQGIRKYEDATINQIVSQARTGMMPDPGAIADKVLQPRFTARAQEIRNMVGPDVWRRVASADFGNIMQAARDPQTGEVAARKLAALIRSKDQNGLLDLTYGPNLAQEMRLYSSRLDARGGKIPAGALNPDNFGQVMRRLEVAQTSRDAFMQQNYLSELANGGPSVDDAIGYVLRPGQEARLMEAQRFFGDTSPQMAAVRKQALKELLNSAITRTETGAGTQVVGDGIDQALRRWTPRQQEIMFPNGLADDMRRLAQEIRFMFPRRGDQIGGALIAGAVKNLPLPARIPAMAYYEGMGWIFSQPSVVRAIANGLQPGAKKAATREAIRMIFREAAVGELPHPNEEPEPGVMGPGQAAMTVLGRNYGLMQPTPAAPSRVPPRGPTVTPPSPTPARRKMNSDGEFIEPPPRDLRPSVGGP